MRNNIKPVNLKKLPDINARNNQDPELEEFCEEDYFQSKNLDEINQELVAFRKSRHSNRRNSYSDLQGLLKNKAFEDVDSFMAR